MYILAIETTGAFASVALMKEGKIIGQVQGSDRFSHLQNLMPQVKSVLKDNKLSLGDISAIAVSKGPGSFTGIRIGVSSARALAQILDIPCIPVSSLEALAIRAEEGQLSSEAEGGSVLICPILDARRSQVYGGGYFIEDGYPVEKVKAGAYTIEEFLKAVQGYEKVMFLGDGADACKGRIEELRPAGTLTALESIRYQRADSVAMLGARSFAEKGGMDYFQLEPDYMRLAEAERKLKES
ncbi:MAG: tRNA (adenosine(37)-N6)-threonylcarbamoyltransferase complex dimerization subunit type 1 TsaB [Clostridiales bacterium]|nr:tRNA (adenosine(37)-N6)-threonylcarbamoyltransferase complex dimerization subunit type 1 TsaB [Clostridiales bacterium]